MTTPALDSLIREVVKLRSMNASLVRWNVILAVTVAMNLLVWFWRWM